MQSFLRLKGASTTSRTASRPVNLPTLKTGSILSYKLPRARQYKPSMRTFFWSNAAMQSCIFMSYNQQQNIQQNIKGTLVHSWLLSEIIPGNLSVIVVNLKPRLFWSWKFPKVWVVSTCLVSLSSTVFNH